MRVQDIKHVRQLKRGCNQFGKDVINSDDHSLLALVCESPCASTSVFFFQAEDGIRDYKVTGVQTCALPISTGSTCRPTRRSATRRRTSATTTCAATAAR